MKLAAVALVLFAPFLYGAETGYVGRQVCAGCHKSIAATQITTAMAQTWQGTTPKQIPAIYTATHAEGASSPIQYRVDRNRNAFTFQVTMPGHAPQRFTIDATTGGARHGLSFFFRVKELEGIPIAEAPLVEGRYLHYVPHGRLELSPGFPQEKPANYETALGRVLAPGFRQKCLTCHGQTRTVDGSHQESGVTCESCHGPGQHHLAAIGAHSAEPRILNPKNLPVHERMQTCAQCHSGFSLVEDPLPDDLLISDQVTALENTECFRQSGGNITCTNCHNPHQDVPRAVLVQRSETTCLGCHNTQSAKHPALCPVNRKTGCVGCHMPTKVKAPLHVADHWIRVQHSSAGPSVPHPLEWRSTLEPQHMYLRAIVANDREQAEELRRQLVSGASFFDLARARSADPDSGQAGGYLGDFTREQMDPAWAAAALRLNHGEISDVISWQNRFLILGRMPRNFREEAGRLYDRAMELRKQGKRDEAQAGFVEALKTYPHLLRALTFLGVGYGEGGNAQAAASVLSIATQLYPKDAGAHFNLGVAYGALGKDEELSEYKKALEVDPDLVSAYLNWGAAAYAKGKVDEAIELYRKGISVNPLVASLHYSLAVALEQRGNKAEASKEYALANKIDPDGSKQP